MPILFTKINVENANNTVWVWKIDLEKDASLLEDMLLIYPPDLANFKNISRKMQWAVSRKIVFDNYLGKKVLQEENGYPSIEGENCFLSISHCKDLLVVKTSNKPCGIDVEEISERVVKIKDKFLSEAEKLMFEGSTENLLIAWTAKEAIYKMLNTPGLEFKSQLIINDINHDSGVIEAQYILENESFGVKLKFEKIENYIFTQTL